MPNTDVATPEAMQKASDLLEKFLQQQDYFNFEKMDEIQILAIGQADFFEVKAWQDLLKNQKDIALYFTHFLNFYLANHRVISELYEEELKDQTQRIEHFFELNPQFFDLEKTINQDENLNALNEIMFEPQLDEVKSLEKLAILNYWLQAFTPFAEQNVPLVWQGFQQFPFEIFRFVQQISAKNLNPQDIEIFYDLFTQQKLDFAQEGQRPSDYIQHFYDQFPALLLEIPKRFAQTESIHFKVKLLICLAHRKNELSEPLQQFILDTFIGSSQIQQNEIFDASLHALKKCQSIEISIDVMDQLKALLHEQEIWYFPMVAMQVLNDLGVRENWFKQHLLEALDDPYGCDDLTPQGTSIEILTSWGNDGLYATDKITQILQQAIQENDQESIANLTVYMDAYPQLATHFQPILWQWMVHLSTLPQDECWIEGKTLQTFLQLNVGLAWQPNQAQWQSLERVMCEFLEYILPEDREAYFDLLLENPQINPQDVQQLRQFIIAKDAENQLLMQQEQENAD